MNSRKLYRSGNSVVVSIPSYMLDQLDWPVGSEVCLTFDTDPDFIRITRSVNSAPSPPRDRKRASRQPSS